MAKRNPVTRCTICGEVLDHGSFHYRVEGKWFCIDCLTEFAREYFRWALEPAE